MSLTVTFVSNYINHHQIPFCEAMLSRIGDGFVFVQTQDMEEERLAMGWADESDRLDWVISWKEEGKLARSEILSCDLLIAGWAPEAQDAIEQRLSLHRPVFRISERIYKDGQWKVISPRGLAAKYREHIRYRREPYFLLCAGAYVASDFRLIHAFPHKMYCWGYFPPMRVYKEGRPPVRHRSAQDAARLVWAGRFADFKHVERALTLAGQLADDGRKFVLHIVGGGSGSSQEKAEEAAHRYVEEHGLEEKVVFHGFCSPGDVRRCMEESDIFLLTSDRGEGWGAVLNEAMNSGCAPVAGAPAGAVPYLVRNGVNGYIYSDGDEEDFTAKVERLIDDSELCERFAAMAYRSIRASWNADTAAQRLLRFGETVLDACDKAAEEAQHSGARAKGLPMQLLNRDLPMEGPMSVAPLIKPYLEVSRMASNRDYYRRMNSRMDSGQTTD